MTASTAVLIPLALAVVASCGALARQVICDARERASRSPRHGEGAK